MTSSIHCAGTTEDYVLPGAEALLAGTLALMTGLAQSAAEGAGAPANAEAMRCKIIENLGALAAHAGLSQPMRQMVARLQGHWERTAHAASAGPRERAAWLPSPALLQ